MAFRYLIYSTGTTFSTTIVRESATNNPAALEASYFTDFVIPEIQPLYLWRVDNAGTPTTVLPNTDVNISGYLQSIAPAPQPEDDATIGFVTGETATKIDKVTGATSNVGIFTADGSLEDSGYAIADLTGSTQTLVGSGGTTVIESGSTTIIFSAPPTGSTTTWGSITGTLSAQTDLQNALNLKLDITDFNSYTGDTATLIGTKLDTTLFNTYTGTTATEIGNKLDTTIFDTFTGTTLPANYYDKTEINTYTGATDTRLDDLEAIGNVAITGVTNGLTATGQVAELGGNLTKDTVISGTTFDFTVNTDKIKLQAITGIDIIDTDGVGGINIESDAGTITLKGNTNLGAEVTKIEISETSMLITDGRATQVGLQYAGDYSTDFTDESLITKRYADAIAAGLIPKAAVLVATTSNTALSGLLTIDGVTLTVGDRVLVKDNTDASENGIYVAAAGAWTRSTDFDGNPDGEVSAGNIIPVLSGDTSYSSLWVLVTPNPIVVDTTDLEFSLFSSPHELQAGHGISLNINEISVDGASLAGNSITWTGATGSETYNVDPSTGTLATALGTKLDATVFNTFTGTTLPAGYLSIANFNVFTGTTLPANYYNKTEINTYTGATDTRLDGIESEITGLTASTATKLDIAVFSAYTGTTAPNEIFLIHTGGTELNTIIATAIEWDTEEVSGAAFSWTGSTEIEILETGLFEVSYNIPYNITANSAIGVGANIILNNATVIDITAAAGLATRSAGAASIGLPTVILSLTAGDVLNLATFRTHQSGAATSSLTGSILIKKKNTLQ